MDATPDDLMARIELEKSAKASRLLARDDGTSFTPGASVAQLHTPADVANSDALEKTAQETAPPEETLGKLAALAPLDYEAIRKSEAKHLEVRVSVLDDLVDHRRKQRKSAPAVEPEDPDPELVIAVNNLLHAHDILGLVVDVAAKDGLVGEEDAIKLMYLIITSRLLDRPVSAKVEGPSSAGKSEVMRKTLKFFPPSAYYRLTGMSEKLLVYSDEPLQHRVLVMAEALAEVERIGAMLTRALSPRYKVKERAA